MYKYAQMLNGKVHWLFNDEMTLQELYLNKFSKEIVFVDITNNTQGIAEGWNYVDGEFINPNPPEKVLAQFKKVKSHELYLDGFIPAKEKVVWLNGYGYDCKESDQLNWNNALLLLEKGNLATINYKVWLNDNEKGLKEHTMEMLISVGLSVAKQQKEAYEIFKALQKKVETATTIEEVELIMWPKGE